LCRSHPQCPFHTFGNLRRMDLPLRGDFTGLLAQVAY
jgi:hypothetical protein